MIRKATARDFDFIYRLYMHPDVNLFLLYEPMSKKEFEPIFRDLLDKEILYVYEEESKDAGMFKLVPYTHRTSHTAYLGGLAIDPSSGGKGLGFRMLKEIIELGREKGLLRIELSVAHFNERAIHLYTKVGFEKEGLLRKYTHLKSENRFWDEIMMAYLYV